MIRALLPWKVRTKHKFLTKSSKDKILSTKTISSNKPKSFKILIQSNKPFWKSWGMLWARKWSRKRMVVMTYQTQKNRSNYLLEVRKNPISSCLSMITLQTLWITNITTDLAIKKSNKIFSSSQKDSLKGVNQ